VKKADIPHVRFVEDRLIRCVEWADCPCCGRGAALAAVDRAARLMASDRRNCGA
jgi:hypothetical protein